MREKIIKYQTALDKHKVRMKTFWLWFFVTISAGLIGFPFLINGSGVGALLLLSVIPGMVVLLAKSIQYSNNQKKIEQYRIKNKLSFERKGDATYCLIAPFDTKSTIDRICKALSIIGEVADIDSYRGIIQGMIRISSKRKESVTIYVEQSNEECSVRACFKRKWNDSWWDMFLCTLFEQNPNVDFGVTLSRADPTVACVLNLNGDTKQVFTSRTSGGTSLSGFLVGGALFGDAGAIVGGLSGEQRTVTSSQTVFSDELLVRIVYSNGRLWEGTVRKGTQLYHEIMVNI